MKTDIVTQQEVEHLALMLLDDDDGICPDGWELLNHLLDRFDSDMGEHVECFAERYYLNVDAAKEYRKKFGLEKAPLPPLDPQPPVGPPS